MLISVTLKGEGESGPLDTTIIFTSDRGWNRLQNLMYEMGWTVDSQVSVIDNLKGEKENEIKR